MKNNLLLRTNILLCGVLTVIFVITAIISYQSNIKMFRKETEHIAYLISENVYYQSESSFNHYATVSRAMANDSMLKRFLAEETEEIDYVYLTQIQEYLNTYKEQSGGASAFFVSAKTNRYYHFSGQYRTLIPGVPDNDWYFDLLNSTEEYSFDTGKDAYIGNMYFIDVKIYDENDNVIGVIGLGFYMNELRELMQNQYKEYDIGAMLIGASDDMVMYDWEYAPVFSEFKHLDRPFIESIIAETGMGRKAVWGDEERHDCYTAALYIPDLKSYLILENEMSKQREQFERQLAIRIGFTALIALSILLIFNKVVLSYNARLLKQVVSQEMEYYNLLVGAVKALYSDVYEFDVTHGVPAGKSTRQYFESIGIHNESHFEEAMKILTEIRIKEEFQEGFAAMFSQENVLEAFAKGIRELDYDCMISTPEKGYKWVRMQARLFYYNSDKSVHMIVFTQDINDEKEREDRLISMAETDPLTGLYNKSAVREYISAALAQTEKDSVCAFIIADIDYFKRVNDTLGHIVGDRVIKDFADKLRRQFRDADDVCGRIGGDEFVVLLRDIPGGNWLAGKLEKLTAVLRWEVSDSRRQTDGGKDICAVSASIGVACYPQAGEDFDTLYQNADAALYQAKENGRDRFVIYGNSCNCD